jgi:hypothetical protein
MVTMGVRGRGASDVAVIWFDNLSGYMQLGPSPVLAVARKL